MNATSDISATGQHPTRYDGLSIALHWLTAALVMLEFLLAETWGFFPKSVRQPMIMVLVGGHALAALGHHYLLRDNVLRRMLPCR
jgi:cytochrome b561